MRYRLRLHLLVPCLSLSLCLPCIHAQGGGARIGGAANQVEGTGQGAGGPGDGNGPGNGAGQGLGPGAKNINEQHSKDKADSHGKIGRKEKADNNHREAKKDSNEDRGQREKSDRNRNEHSSTDQQRAGEDKDHLHATTPFEQRDHSGNKPVKDADSSKQKADQSTSPIDLVKPSTPRAPDHPGSHADRNPTDKASPDKRETASNAKEPDRHKKPGGKEPGAGDHTPKPEEKELPPRPSSASDAAPGGSPSTPSDTSDTGDHPNAQPTRTPQGLPSQQSAPDQRDSAHRSDQPSRPNHPGQPNNTQTPVNQSPGGTTKESPVPKSDAETPNSSTGSPSSKIPGGNNRNPSVKPSPLPKHESPIAPATPGQPKGSGGISLIPGAPPSLVPSAPKTTAVIAGGGTLPSVPRLDSPTSVAEAVFALPRSLIERLFGSPKKRSPSVPSHRTFSSGKAVLAAEKPFRSRKRGGGLFFGIIKPEIPNLWQAAKVQRVMIDHRITSPRTITYKSRFSRVSRWIAPLTLGIATYIPYETMNASVAARLNNLMAEEEISVEKDVTARFTAEISGSKRFRVANPPEAVFELEITRYALDPMPLSIGRMKPTVSVTGRLYDANGQLLWIGKGFSTILERGIRGATVEQYEDDPALLHYDFRASVSSAIRRLVAMANMVPRATVTVTPVKETP